MYYRDQHCHSEFSFDSNEKISNYLKQVNHDIITTEHMDLGYIDRNNIKKDIDINYDKYCEEIENYNKISRKKILKGIEIGYSEENINRIIEKIENRNYDLHLLSIHQVNNIDAMSIRASELNQREFLKDYYETMIKAINSFKNFDVLTHIDYALRINKFDSKNLDIVDEYLTYVFKEIINDEKSLEVNTRSIYQYNNLDYYTFALKKYVKMKGQLVSIGSDAHSETYYRYNFDKAFELLSSIGIKYACMYENRKMKVIKVEDL